MYKHTFKIFCAIILISITSLQAQNYNDAIRLGFPGLGSNARALGMGNAFNALSDDASASYFNPAGFGLIKKMELSGGLSFNNFDNTTTLFETETKDNTTNTSLNRISFALPFPTYQGSLVFGLSYHQSKDLSSILKFNGFNSGNHSKIQDLNTIYDNDGYTIPYWLYLTDDTLNSFVNGNLNQSGSIFNTGSIDNWSFSGAIEVEKNFFVGGNLTVINGSFEATKEYYEDDTKSLYAWTIGADNLDFDYFNFNENIKWEIGGWNAKLGFLYQFEDLARFGATVQFPKVYSINETYSYTAASFFKSGFTEDLSYEDEVSYDITTPFELTGAVAINFKGIILSAEATLIDYSQLKFSNAEGLSSSTISDINQEIKDILTSALNYNVGFEYTVPTVGLRIRGGFMSQPSPFDGDDFNFAHKYITGGLGYLANGKIGIDVAYAYGWWKDIGDNYDSGLSRTFQDIKNGTVMLTTTYRF